LVSGLPAARAALAAVKDGDWAGLNRANAAVVASIMAGG